MKILVIDNDESIRLGAIEILKMKGFTAISIENVEKAILYIEKEKNCHIIISSENSSHNFEIPFVYIEKPYTAQQLLDIVNSYGVKNL